MRTRCRGRRRKIQKEGRYEEGRVMTLSRFAAIPAFFLLFSARLRGMFVLEEFNFSRVIYEESK